ncbi:MAG: insulinase family protein, partial [Planctomycetota bacterium]|nr:insulinase family protein [Planctomycetota bacterium]
KRQAQLSCLINNRELYSRMRFLSHLCPEEPYRLYEYGDEKEVEKLDNKSLFNFYQRLLQETPFIIYTDGLDHDDVLTVLDGLGRNAPAITPFEQKCRVARKRIKKVSEKMDVKQAFLWLGFRADLPPTDERATAAQLLSAIFGGMPTSRLFKTVRLKNSLAYDIYSSYVRSKGILSTFSCVAVENVTATERLIMSEWNKILKGDINDEEISVAKKHIIQDLESLSDSPLALADFYAYGLLLGMKESPERRIASIRRLKRDDIISVAQLFKCDTLFSLLPQKTKPGVSECRK